MPHSQPAGDRAYGNIALAAARQAVGIFIITPNGNVLEDLVVRAVIQVVVRHNAVASGGVDQVIEADLSLAPGVAVIAGLHAPARRHRTLAIEFNAAHLNAFKDFNSLAGGVLQQEMVELGARHLEGIGRVAAQLAKIERPAFPPPHQEGAVLALKAGLLHLFPGAEHVHHLQNGGQERFADMIAREAGCFQQGYVEAGASQQRGCRCASRTTADDKIWVVSGMLSIKAPYIVIAE